MNERKFLYLKNFSTSPGSGVNEKNSYSSTLHFPFPESLPSTLDNDLYFKGNIYIF
jgi:hypothetical protein